MNYSTNDSYPAETPLESELPATVQNDNTSDSAVFPGDLGRIPHETRRVLVQLLLGPAVDGRRQGNLWAVLLRDEPVLRERLHELFLELVIDHDQKVAFTRQVVAEDIEIPVLLRRAHLTFLESVLILFLRQRLTQADTHGDRAVVSWLETCLAAALRYQLGGHDRALPTYSTVVLDEAFDKADAEFTAMAMNIFKTFGFQMIVATPLKSVMTLEPFIGGACFIHIKDRKFSAAIPIDYDDETQRLKWKAEDGDGQETAAA